MDRGESVSVYDFLRDEEIVNNTHGDSVTIKALLEELKMEYKNVRYTSYRDLGILGKIIEMLWGLKKRSKSTLNGNRLRWVATAFLYILIDKLAIIDLGFSKCAGLNKYGSYEDLIIGRPFYFSHFERTIKNNGKGKISLLEHNIEKSFFGFQLGKLGFFSKILLNDISKIEKHALKEASMIYTVSVKDKNVLADEYPAIKVKKINYNGINSIDHLQLLIPFRNVNSGTFPNKYDPQVNIDRLKVGFIGSNYSLNVESVKLLINIAKHIENKGIIFMIIGEVSSSFKDTIDIPSNLIFWGFVKDTYSVLSMCDAYILFDLMPTGIETKSLLYKQFVKLVLLVGQDNSEYDENLGDRVLILHNKDDVINFLENYHNLRRGANLTILDKRGIRWGRGGDNFQSQ